MITKQLDLRTPLQKEKDERNKKIYEEYLSILQNPPEGATKWAIWRALGQKHGGLHPQGVRAVILKMEKNK
ncbi:hypothetical protein NZD85_09730 [Empedobacter stercoris]|uniref:hypothetical protein n=1 Tax=Empedobacter stercoris TaxID=1628248 RepID=UPI00050A17A7|nr:hypothetical protein [Empedobacter stercoris]UWX66174.1 hypothetical protein NZD85_09730 [Empedobacter stercoris]